MTGFQFGILITNCRHRFILTDSEKFYLVAQTEQDDHCASGKGFTKSLKFDVTTADTSLGANDEIFVQTKIERRAKFKLSHGTAGAEKVTFSFYIKSNYWRISSLMDIVNDDAGRAYVATIICCKYLGVQNNYCCRGHYWVRYPNDNGVGFEVRLYLGAGSDKRRSSNQNAWGTNAARSSSRRANINGFYSNDWFITGVQLEVGEKATPFEHRSYGDEFDRCLRYYQRLGCFQSYVAVGSGVQGSTLTPHQIL